MGRIGNCLYAGGRGWSWCPPSPTARATRSEAAGRSPSSRAGLCAAGALLLAFVHEPAAATPSCSRAVVASISVTGTLVLSTPVDGASEVVLAGIDALAGTRALAEEARQQLADLLVGQDVCLAAEDGADSLDRYARLVAQVERGDGLWVQGGLLARGLARVHPTPAVHSRIREMLAIESEARTGRRGLWRLASMRVQPADAVDPAATGLQIIEGRVLEAERRGDWWYLNFGTDWRRDFTVTLNKRSLPPFAAAGIEPYALRGTTIRVRGVLQWLNGPMIEALVPEQIETVAAVGD